jgi:hypothetical protein
VHGESPGRRSAASAFKKPTGLDIPGGFLRLGQLVDLGSPMITHDLIVSAGELCYIEVA